MDPAAAEEARPAAGSPEAPTRPSRDAKAASVPAEIKPARGKAAKGAAASKGTTEPAATTPVEKGHVDEEPVSTPAPARSSRVKGKASKEIELIVSDAEVVVPAPASVSAKATRGKTAVADALPAPAEEPTPAASKSTRGKARPAPALHAEDTIPLSAPPAAEPATPDAVEVAGRKRKAGGQADSATKAPRSAARDSAVTTPAPDTEAHSAARKRSAGKVSLMF